MLLTVGTVTKFDSLILNLLNLRGHTELHKNRYLLSVVNKQELIALSPNLLLLFHPFVYIFPLSVGFFCLPLVLYLHKETQQRTIWIFIYIRRGNLAQYLCGKK
jgi:hypothetical protein